MAIAGRTRGVAVRDALGAAWALARRPLRLRRAHHVQVVVSDRCNLACHGCFKADPAHRPTNVDMPVERFATLLDRLRPRLVTLAAEGDPLLHPQLEELIALVRARGARALMATGLTTGDAPRLRGLVRAGLTGARVVLTHTDRETYRRVRGRDLLPEVLERLAVWTAEPDLALVVELWIPPEELARVEESFDGLAAAGIRRVRYLVHPTLARPRLVLTDEERVELETAAARAETRALSTNLAQLARRSTPRAVESGRCALPWLRAYVHVDGRAGPCADVVNGAPSDTSIHLPNVFEGSEPRPFAGPAFRAWRRAFRAHRPPHRVCVGCAKGALGSLRCASRLRLR